MAALEPVRGLRGISSKGAVTLELNLGTPCLQAG